MITDSCANIWRWFIKISSRWYIFLSVRSLYRCRGQKGQGALVPRWRLFPSNMAFIFVLRTNFQIIGVSSAVQTYLALLLSATILVVWLQRRGRQKLKSHEVTRSLNIFIFCFCSSSRLPFVVIQQVFSLPPRVKTLFCIFFFFLQSLFKLRGKSKIHQRTAWWRPS